MGTQKPAHQLFLVLLMTTIFLATFTGVGATALFDGKVIFRWKADPQLQTHLPQDQTGSRQLISLILVLSEAPSQSQLNALETLGSIRTIIGRVATMDLPISLLERLAAFDFVERISRPRTLKSQLDASVPDIQADKVWNSVRDSVGNTVNGSGVIIGFEDSGIDYLHKDFYFANGTSKILYIWDQTVNGRNPQDFHYGNECNQADIQGRTCGEFDGGSAGLIDGHGTAVAAVAASTGQATTLFSSCMLYDGVNWSDDTTQCGNSQGTTFSLLASPTDFRYLGQSEPFNKIYFDLAEAGNYGPITWQYSRGSGQWGILDVSDFPVCTLGDILICNTANYTPDEKSIFRVVPDGTAGFTRNGTVVIVPPADWKTETVNGIQGKYWVRMRAANIDKPAAVYHIQQNQPYFGVAPGASIISVKLKDGSEDHVLDGLHYLVNKARELRRPLVIDHSLGDALGSHDGSEALELAMTDLAQDGVPIVVSAGNSGDANLHARGKLNPGQTAIITWTIEELSSQSSIDLWYSTTDFLGISVRTPSGRIVNGPTSDAGVDTQDGNVVILQGERPSGREWWISVSAQPGGVLQSTAWSLALTGAKVADGRWDAWTEPGKFTTNGMTDQYSVDLHDTIDYPGTARGVITVGSYLTRFYWRSGCTICIEYSQSQGKRGVWWNKPPAPDVGALTNSSGVGPTRDGRMKPEISAPGSNIITARSSTRAPRQSDPDNYHQVWAGTSFAAPHVAGAIALMLQMNQYLTPNEIRTILTEDARQDQFTGSINAQTGSPYWGWGKVNALKSTQDAPSLYSVKLEIPSVGSNATVTVKLDGETLFTTPLNATRIAILEFRQGGAHNVEITPAIIQTEPGSRYVVTGTPWTFSSGGARSFGFRQQYFLDVTSQFGHTLGTGWYDANFTATAGVYPSGINQYHFSGWSGSTNSTSISVQIRMDSSKTLVAQWKQDASTSSQYIVAILLLAFAAGATMIFSNGKTRRLRRVPQSLSGP